ncbi:MAG: alcohol dehydrogenase catalytic domain-containing protein [Chloroflexi bacterium]|nr:alcohol dehydrogenase catalytic domain-containing protein [Chloroflexota bacterium]MCL5109314.1 alcohol dehydrogenase catalytic domain-containing protein [Chloroflexota bacterium]
MRAIVLHGPNDLRQEEVPLPVLQPGELLVRTRAAAVCGTDLRIIAGTKTRGVTIPGIIGHELAGDVAELADPVANFRVGDRVCVAPIIACGHCYYCTHGLENLCGDQQIIGYNHSGGFAEYVRVPARAVAAGNVFRLPPGVTYEEGALVEPLSCCVNGHEKSRLRFGQSVLIVGAGPIGLLHLQLALAAGAAQVIISESLPGRRRKAAEMGASAVVDPANEDLAAVVRARTEGVGVDAIVMAFGAPELVNSTFSLARKGGVVNLFAGFPGRGEAVIEANLIHYNETTVVGTSSSTNRHFAKALALVARGNVDVGSLVGRVYGLAEVDKAIAAVRGHETLKAVLHPDE